MTDERKEERRVGRDRTTLTLKRHSPSLEVGELIVVAEKAQKKFLVTYNGSKFKVEEVK